MSRLAVPVISVLVAFPPAIAATAVANPQPVALRIAGTAFGGAAELEVHDLARAEGDAALGAAWQALRAVERELQELATQASRQPLSLGAEMAERLARSQTFCRWSDGATSALGGPVHRLWGLPSPVAALPIPTELAAAASSSRCDRMLLDGRSGRLELAAGSELDFRPFARGWAVDRAMATLAEHRSTNAWVRIGPVARAAGGGPDGDGWPLPLPRFAAQEDSIGTLLVRDQAIALVNPSEGALEIAGERIAPYFDLRSGRPVTGVVGVVVATELAGDAEPLATALAVFGANDGQLRLGGLKPKPSVLWLLGPADSKAPLLVTSHWSAVKKR